MFKECKTLAELNAKRIQATTQGIDLVEVNNAYNIRRQEILTARKPFVQVIPIVVKPKEAQQFCGVPVVGRTNKVGCIELTDKGFLY